MNRVTINGTTISVEGSGTTVSIKDGQVTINGKPVGARMENVLRVEWSGPAAKITCDASITCGDVGGDVHAGGSVQCDDVQGHVTAGGSVQCDDVGGNITAGGSVMRS